MRKADVAGVRTDIEVLEVGLHVASLAVGDSSDGKGDVRTHRRIEVGSTEWEI